MSTTTTKHTVTKLKSEDFGSFQLFQAAVRKSFHQDMVVLRLNRFNAQDPNDLDYFRDLNGCSEECPYTLTNAPKAPALSTEEEIKKHDAKLAAWKTKWDLIREWKKSRTKADKDFQEEISNATQWSLYLLGAFPEKCPTADNIKERVLASAYDPLDKEVSLDKPRSIMAAVEKIFSQGSSQGTYSASLWVKEFYDYKLPIDGRTPTVPELRKFLELLTKLERDHDQVFYGSACDKPGNLNCKRSLMACGCSWSKRILNNKITLLSTWIGRLIPSLTKTSELGRLVEARNAICSHAPSELTADKLTKFITDVQKYSGDLSLETPRSQPKTANAVDKPKPKEDLRLPQTLEKWKNGLCTPDRHKNFRHKAAECRVMLSQAKEEGLFGRIKGLEAYYNHFVVNKNTHPPEGGFKHEGGSQRSSKQKGSARPDKRKADDSNDKSASDESATDEQSDKKVRRMQGANSILEDTFSDSDYSDNDNTAYLDALRLKAVRSIRKRQRIEETPVLRIAGRLDNEEPVATPPLYKEVHGKGKPLASRLDTALTIAPGPASLDRSQRLTVYSSRREGRKRKRSGRVVIDTGCRQSTFNSPALLDNVSSYVESDPFVVTAGGHKLPIEEHGEMSIEVIQGEPPMKHKGCLVVPSCQENLFSLTSLLASNPSICAIATSDGIRTATLDDGLRRTLKDATPFAYLESGTYYMEPSVLGKTAYSSRREDKVPDMGETFLGRTISTTNVDTKAMAHWYKLHRRFGHTDLRGLVDLLEENSSLNKAVKPYLTHREIDCVLCDMGKLRYERPLATDSPATRLMQRVHVDSFPLPSPDLSNRMHCTLLVEEFSRFKFTFFTKHKNEEEIGKTVISVVKRWSQRTGLELQELRSDGGGEFLNSSVLAYLKSVGAESKASPAYTQALNGLVEANVGKLKDTARCMMLDSNLCIQFSSYAIDYAAVLSNLHIHPFTKTRPYTVWFRRRPNLDHYLPFGCLVTVYEPKETRNRQGQKGMPGIFLGTLGSGVYRVFTFAQQTIKHERLIKPYTDRFPGLRFVQGRYQPILDPKVFLPTQPEPSEVERDRHELCSAWDAIEEEPAPIQGESQIGPIPVAADEHNATLEQSDDTAFATEMSIDAALKGSESAANVCEEANTVSEVAQEQTAEELSTAPTVPTELEIGLQNDVNPMEKATVDDSIDEVLGVGSTEAGDGAGCQNQEDVPSGLSNFVPDVEVQPLRGNRFRVKYVNMLLNKPMSPKPDRSILYCRSLSSRSFNPLRDANLWEYKGLGTKPLQPDIKVLDSQPAPMSYSQVAKHEFKDHWISAMQAEMASLKDKDTWEEVELPPGRKPVGLVWKFKYKNKGETIDKFKARLCVLGNTQTAGVDYDPENIFAPVMRGSTMRAALALFGPKGSRKMWITQADYTLAFLNASPKEIVIVKPPPGFPMNDPKKYMLLKRSLYGLCQSPREWYEYLRAWLLSQGFVESKSDPCLFTREGRGGRLEIILVYVDDTLILASNRQTAEAIKELMRSKFEMTDVEDADKVIGVEIFRVKGGLCLGQPTYAKMMLEEAELWDIDTSKLPGNPMSEHWAHDDNSAELTGSEKTWFISYLMKIAWMSQQTRIDLAATASILAQYLTKPTKSDLAALRRCLLYLRGTYDDVLFYQDERVGEMIVEVDDDVPIHNSNDSGLLVAYSDASFANEPGRRSRSGGCILIRGAVIDWASKKQSMVALSSTEAEYYSVSQVAQSVLHFRKVLRDMGVEITAPTTIYEDNKSCIAIAYKPKHHGRTKHFDIKAHFIRDHVEKKDVELVYCPTEMMVADMLTKALPPGQHRRLKQYAGMRSLSSLSIEKLNQD